ncbi:hypothetical protein CYFUS_006361 [Cystobacter fuscus]|uniref:Uncharacterized protein n=2 Tax=Cystobacter fuscus TaxID=43 RepID=A0A250JAF3_9BACT|nr:hypothetical protein CYFUS_006361 [Cystobacter fuscus]
MSIADDLVDHVIESHQSTDETNKRLRDLTAGMGMFFASGTAKRLLKSSETEAVWKNYVTDKGEPIANVRIATIDLNSIFERQVLFLKQTSSDPRAQDGSSGNRAGSESPPILRFYPHLIGWVVQYLERLLTTELAPLAAIAKAAADSSNDAGSRRAIISLDYYSDRSTTTSVLHKDTTGITLFVALHYINPEPMLGPEYIFDKWPIGSTEGAKHNFSPYDKGSNGGEDVRFHAPWTKSRGHYYWPRKLLEELEEARAQLPDDSTLHHVDLSPYGLVSFVDELIYHATPLNRTRLESDKDKLFRDVTFSSRKYKVLPQGLTRTVSMKLKQGETLTSLTGGSTKRCFIRLWISVCDASWYNPVYTYTRG